MNHSKWIRENLQQAAEQLKLKGYDFDIEQYENLEAKRKVEQNKSQQLQEQRNAKSKEVGVLKHQKLPADSLIEELNKISDELKVVLASLKSIQSELFKIESFLPNIAHVSVPCGLSEKDNVVIGEFGKVDKKSFAVLDHVSLGEKKGLDFATAGKMSGARFVIYSAKLAKLHRVLANWMLDTHIEKHGYIETNPPLLVGMDALFFSGQLPKFADDLFICESAAMGLIPTAEVSLVNCCADRVFKPAELPLKLVAHTPCFRKEAGSYGKDTRGLVRTHQFEKVELVQAVMPEHSYDALEDIVKHSQFILQSLELPYRVVELCTGDLGFGAAKTYDLEVWVASQNCYREIASISNCESFQARRMQARVKSGSKLEYIHTLNGSGLAVSRTLVAIMENFQNKDGSITMPDVLRARLGFDFID